MFRNRLHTIAGLIELGEYDEVRRYVSRISASSDQWQTEVTGRIGEPAVAALLIAKASLAAEQGIELRMSKTSGQRGLGLALTKQACVRRGGSVSVHNAEGAVFTATLPIVPEMPQ
ncbi:sensor histidine kinase [Nocardia gipuzkoensis]